LRGTYITITEPFHETFLLPSAGFEEHLRNAFFRKHEEKILTRKDCGTVVSVLLSRAKADGIGADIDIRVAALGGAAIYIDLCNAKKEVIKATAEGYTIESNYPIHFLRPQGMQSLPTPESNDSTLCELLQQLYPHLLLSNIVMLAAFLISALLPRRSKPCLAVGGGQGSGNELRRLGPDLRRKGIEVSFNATKRARQIVIERMPVERGNEE